MANINSVYASKLPLCLPQTKTLMWQHNNELHANRGKRNAAIKLFYFILFVYERNHPEVGDASIALNFPIARGVALHTH